MRKNTNLIQCADHSWCPWHVVCIHILEHKVKDAVLHAVAPDDGREVDGDYLCLSCHDIVQEAGKFEAVFEDLRPVCMHCMRNQIRPTLKVIDADTGEEV